MSPSKRSKGRGRRTAKSLGHEQGAGGGPPSSLLLGILAISAAAVFLNGFSGAFVFDDLIWIVRNDSVHSPWPPDWMTFGRRPVVNFTLAVNFAMNRLETPGYHFANLVIHVLAGFTLFGIVRRTMLGPRMDSARAGSAAWFAFSVALIWLVHPLQTQSVTYIVQRGESMMGLFYLLIIYCLIRGMGSASSKRWYILAVVASACGMGCKAVMITAPVVVLLYDRIFWADSWKKLLQGRWPLYAGLASTWGILFALGIVKGVFGAPSESATVGFAYMGVGPLQYAQSQPGVILHYLGLSFWPAGLCLDYAWQPVEGWSEAAVPIVLIGMLVAGMIVALFKKPWLGFLGFWMFGILFPTSSFIPIRDLIFEHRMYLPLAAVVVAVVALARWALRKFVGDSKRHLVAGGLLAVVVLCLGARTVVRNCDYRSRQTLWQSVVDHSPENHRAHYNLGRVLCESSKYGPAITAYREAIRLNPEYADALNNLGRALADTGRVEEALVHFRSAIKIDADFAPALHNLGRELGQLGQYDEAIKQLTASLRVRPNEAGAHSNLGVIYFKMSRFQEAAECYRKAQILSPLAPRSYGNLGMTLAAMGRFDDAGDQYRQALKLDPRDADIRYGLAFALAQGGRVAEAILECETILRNAQNHQAARSLLARLQQLP